MSLAQDLSMWADWLHALTGTEAVAIRFLDAAPADVPQLTRAADAGCSYWTMAEEGGVFCAADRHHLGCAVGAFCHGAPLPLMQAQELQQLADARPSLRYLKEEGGPIPLRRAGPLHYVLYAPLRKSPGVPDLVLLRGQPAALMVLAEAAEAAGVGEQSSAMGRPVCALVPQVLATGRIALSLGCEGARRHSSLKDGEAYVALPGKAVEEIVAQLLRPGAAAGALQRA